MGLTLFANATDPQRSGGVAHSPIVLDVSNWQRNLGLHDVGAAQVGLILMKSGPNTLQHYSIDVIPTCERSASALGGSATSDV